MYHIRQTCTMVRYFFFFTCFKTFRFKKKQIQLKQKHYKVYIWLSGSTQYSTLFIVQQGTVRFLVRLPACVILGTVLNILELSTSLYGHIITMHY